MPDVRDWHAYQATLEVKRREEKRRERLADLPRVLDVTHKAQQVVDHPGWQHFADMLATRMAEVRASRATYAERMVNGNEMGAPLELLKLNVNKCDAELAGLQYAATLIPQIIETGAAVSRAAAGSADH